MSVKLSEICELIVDCPHSTAPNEGTGYPLIRTPNIGPGYFELEGVHRVSEETYNKRNVRAVPRANDLILAREAPAGNVAIIPEGAQMCLGQRTVLIRPDAEKVNPVWLNYYLNAPDQQHALLKNANGATVSHVNMPIIRNLPITLPAICEQKRIADILSTYDKLIENNRRQIALLEEAAQRLYKEWFIDFKFPGHESVAIADGLPEGWINSTLDVLLAESGKRIGPEQRGKYSHYLPIDAIPSKTFSVWESDVIENAQSSLLSFEENDMVFGAMRPYFHKVISAAYSGITRSTCFVLRERKDEYAAYAFMTLTYERTIRYATAISVGTTMPYVRWSDLKRMATVIPEESIAIRFGNQIRPILDCIKRLAKQTAEAKESRNRLLPKLMSGEVEVM